MLSPQRYRGRAESLESPLLIRPVSAETRSIAARAARGTVNEKFSSENLVFHPEITQILPSQSLETLRSPAGSEWYYAFSSLLSPLSFSFLFLFFLFPLSSSSHTHRHFAMTKADIDRVARSREHARDVLCVAKAREQ